MKTFDAQCAQGDLFIRRIDAVPSGCEERPHSGRLVLAHSETGHHHTIEAPPDVVRLFGSGDPLVSYISTSRAVVLRHNRDYDTHTPIEIGEGVYEIRRQREHTPQGWRKVED